MDPITLAMIMGGGAATGAVSGFLGGNSQAKNTNSAIRGLNKMDFAGQTQQLTDYANEGYLPFTKNAGANYGAYEQAVSDFDPSAFAYENADPFAYDLNAKTKGFLDPSMEYQTQQATRAVEGSAANAGKLFSGATGQAIADRSQDIAQQGWKDALQLAMADRGFSYGQYGDQITRDREAKNQAMQASQMGLNNMGNLAQMGANAQMGLTGVNLGAMGNQFQAQNNRDLAIANLRAGKGPGAWGGAMQGMMTGLGQAGNVMGSYYGAKGP